MYQWQAQQLKANANGSSSSSSSLTSSLFGSNTSMVDQISSMVELTKYAMDAMGLSSDARVTFSQITKYRNQLQNEFSQSVKDGFANSGISNVAALSYTVDKYGKITVSGDNAQDRKTAQAWFDANPSFGKEIRENLDKADYEDEASFTISSTGKITLTNGLQDSLQARIDANSAISEGLAQALKEIDGLKLPATISFDENGNLVAMENAALHEWLAANPQIAEGIKKELDKSGVELSAITMQVSSRGELRLQLSNATLDRGQKAMDELTDAGKKIYTGLNSMNIDPNINFTIQIGDDGSINVISDHPDRDKVQRFFEDNPELVKKFRQIETLAGIDDARKAMQLSPTTMRKRIQIESMMSWWAGGNDTSSYFGSYSNNSLSLLSGLNLKV